MMPFSTRFPNPSSHAVPTYSPEVWSTLYQLRARYQESADLWTECELAHLRFVRWLVETGRLVEDGDGEEAGVQVDGAGTPAR